LTATGSGGPIESNDSVTDRGRDHGWPVPVAIEGYSVSAVSGGVVDAVDVGELVAVVVSAEGGVLVTVVALLVSAVVVGAAVETGTVGVVTGGEVFVVAGVPEMRTAKSL